MATSRKYRLPGESKEESQGKKNRKYRLPGEAKGDQKPKKEPFEYGEITPIGEPFKFAGGLITIDPMLSPDPTSAMTLQAAARFVGGPVSRAFQIPQQWAYAYEARSLQRPVEGWNWKIPFSAVTYPSKYGRISEEYLSGTDNPLVNLGIAMIDDPINFAPIAGITKLGRAKAILKAVSFIDDAKVAKLAEKTADILKKPQALQKLYSGLDIEKIKEPILRQEAIIDWLRQSTDIKMLRGKLKVIGATDKDMKKLQPLFNEIEKGKDGMDIMKTSWWNSEKFMRGERTLIGVDPLFGGWTGNARWGTPRALDTQVGKGLAQVERWWTGVNKGVGIRQIGKEATLFGKVRKPVPPEDVVDAQSKINTLERKVANSEDEIVDAEVKYNYWKSGRRQEQVINYAEGRGEREVQDLKLKRDAEVSNINEGVKRVRKAERAKVLYDDNRVRGQFEKVKRLEQLRNELEEQYKLTGGLTTNKIRQIVKEINAQRRELISIAENNNEIERDFLRQIRKHYSEQADDVAIHSEDVRIANESIEKVDVPEDKAKLFKYLIQEERAALGLEVDDIDKLSPEDMELVQTIIKNAENREIENIINKIPISRAAKVTAKERYDQLKLIVRQSKIVRDNDVKIKRMWAKHKQSIKKDSDYYKKLTSDTDRLLKETNETLNDAHNEFVRLWQLRKDVEPWGAKSISDYTDIVRGENSRLMLSKQNWARDIKNKRAELSNRMSELKKQIDPERHAQNLAKAREENLRWKAELDNATNELRAMGFEPQLVKTSDMLFIIDRYKKLATSTKFRQIADRETDLNTIYKTIEDMEPDTPEIWRIITRGIEDLRADAEKYYDPVHWNIIQGFRKINANYYLAENRFREYATIGENYLMRKTVQNAKGNMLLHDFITYNVDHWQKRLKEWGKDIGFITIKGRENPLFQVYNESQMARMTGESERVQRYIKNLHAIRAELVADGELDKASELAEGIIFLEKYNKALSISPKLGPMAANEEFIKIFDSDIQRFFKSRAGKRWGFKGDDPSMLFKVYEEDLRKIMSERTLRYSESYASGTAFEAYKKSFMFDKVRDAEVIKAIEDSGLSNLVDVKNALAKRLSGTTFTRLSNKELDKLIGKTLENQVASEQAVDALADMLIGWIRIVKGPYESGPWRWHKKAIRWYANSALYGGRTTNIQQDFIGDRYSMFLENVSPNNYLPTAKIINAFFPDGYKFAGWRGAPNGKTFINNGRKTYTYGEVRGLFNDLEVNKGFHQSDVVAMAEYMEKSPTSEVKGLANLMNIEDFKRGRIVPGIYKVRAFNEQLGRFGTFVDSLEKGLSPIEAYERVQKVHFDYTKMNDIARQAYPFYYWHYRNVPRQFKNWLQKPAKQQMPFKAIQAGRAAYEPPESEPATIEEVPDYLLPKGYPIGEYNGKDIYFDPTNIPPVVALEITGLLNNPIDFNDTWEDILRNFASGTSPFIQVTAEQLADREFWTGQRITSGGVGAYESGIRDFYGINIEGLELAQRGSHIARGFLPPLDAIQQGLNAYRDFPAALAMVKQVGGFPIRLVDRDKAAFINLGKRSKELKADHKRIKKNLDIMEAKGLGGTDRASVLRDKLDEIELEMKEVNKEFYRRSEELAKKAAQEYQDNLDKISERYNR